MKVKVKVKVFDPLAPFAAFDTVQVHQAALVVQAQGRTATQPIEPKQTPHEDPVIMAGKLASAAYRIHIYLYGR